MNKKYLILSVLGLTSLTGCYEMDTVSLDEYASDEQKAQSKEANPELAQSSITGITALFSVYGECYGTSPKLYHVDYGFASAMLMQDSRGIDMVSDNIGYNWYSSMAEMSDCTPTSYTSEITWNALYSQIRSANSALAGLPAADTEGLDPTLQFYIAQAKAMRAFDYLVLAQTYQFTYAADKTAPCVMIITEENEAEVAANGCTRSSVEEVYAQIMDDINVAISLLEESGVKPSDVLQDKPKRFISLAAAYGIRARANLIMQNWQDAADDAAKAIANFDGAPVSLAEASHPGFNSLTANNWMWGIAIAPTDRVVTSGIVNWPSHMGSFNYGYASVGAWRKVNIKLYNSIASTDVRKGWFLGADGTSANLTPEQQAYAQQSGMVPYTQVKFAPYQDELGTSENACDIPLMRIEEMYYIQAEGTAMAGGDGATILTDFVKTYRDPSYAFTGSGKDVQEECFMQRRVELYGEGLTTFDFLRLQKDFDRRGGGWETEMVYNVPAGSPVLIVPIPEGEINGNKAFTEAMNNPTASMPTVVQD